ncbi:hypothetical protein WICPIJ_009443 [Wickerhamomyces pijperi]|uniref:lytic cellulose monooxygenase (C4-dehydrogenating) n=1 Tax=Wickerhamomyces pijperi TaxID=599730 RepID=A0A9P8PMI9_WICPI|nr:hypothetical protein WICPIJ_009443 [Wickerhamomyces pijperi]
MVNAVSFVALVGALALAKEHTTKSKTSKTKHQKTKHHKTTSSIATSSVEISSSITSAPAAATTSAAPAAFEVAAFGQCGGQSYTGLTNCGLGYECVYQNPYYSQCLAIDYSTVSYAQRWEQCHGVNYNGPTDCVPGFTCSIDNKYFGGCRPGTASSLLTSATYINSTIASSSSSSSSSVDNTPKVPLYGQCGGINYSGPTECAAGAVCKNYSDWYSQCISA